MKRSPLSVVWMLAIVLALCTTGPAVNAWNCVVPVNMQNVEVDDNVVTVNLGNPTSLPITVYIHIDFTVNGKNGEAVIPLSMDAGATYDVVMTFSGTVTVNEIAVCGGIEDGINESPEPVDVTKNKRP